MLVGENVQLSSETSTEESTPLPKRRTEHQLKLCRHQKMQLNLFSSSNKKTGETDLTTW